ncbi:hypothetical protein NE237_002374 [Protea cynaroides]|uniref:Uncharacterized protein n=1 Tax=Protea cynaroides TaxID=273540 RepID=A0A9Q0KUX5_9MAGN|nr:hypothetical protein NE237_002374 [Protea cynaroides]
MKDLGKLPKASGSVKGSFLSSSCKVFPCFLYPRCRLFNHWDSFHIKKSENERGLHEGSVSPPNSTMRKQGNIDQHGCFWNRKEERAEEKLRKEEELKLKEAEHLRGNPLLNNPTSFNVKRRWDDDVVFKNQSRGETKAPKRFINDTIRNDFHRKFLQKYMK